MRETGATGYRIEGVVDRRWRVCRVSARECKAQNGRGVWESVRKEGREGSWVVCKGIDAFFGLARITIKGP